MKTLSLLISLMLAATVCYAGGKTVDYTVNAAVGFPNVTGIAGDDTPVNAVLPAWDLVTGMTAAMPAGTSERDQ